MSTLGQLQHIDMALAVGTAGSAFLAALNLGITFYVDPLFRLLPKEQHLIVFKSVYESGKRLGPPVGILTALCYLYAQYQTPATIRSTWPYVCAALNVGVIPYTFLVMMGTIDECYANQPGSFETWAKMSYGRMALPTLSFLISLYKTSRAALY